VDDIYAIFASGLIVVGLLAGCGEWRIFKMKNPSSGVEVACAIHRGKLSSEDSQRVRQCIDACRRHGFQLESPEDEPAPSPLMPDAVPPSLPASCKG
jgi:hypothetical protein